MDPKSYLIPGFVGRSRGRRPVLTPRQVKAMVKALERGATYAQLAKRYKITRQTVSNYLDIAAGRGDKAGARYLRRKALKQGLTADEATKTTEVKS
jgi:DNA invertase Pin-like site-specific DNA recombinase